MGLLFFGSSLIAQSLNIEGIVVGDLDSEPLPGVNVQVKDTFFGTATDLDGYFKLELENMESATLVFSFVGYKTKEVSVSESSKNMLIRLDEDVFRGSEIVVTGLAASVKRENLANSVASVSAEELLPAPTQSMESALSGKFAGISVSQNTGAPGGGINVNLRGVSTIEGSTQPLYVVDGVIVNNSAIQSGIDIVTAATGAGSRNPQGQPVNRVADINPNDIQNIEVLKGASAAAIYGSKASNGVVIITTKKGQAGHTRINFRQQTGFSTILNKLGTRKFTAETAEETYGPQGRELYEANGGRFIDQEEVLYGEEGLLSLTSLNISGGNNRTNFYVSGTLQDDQGIIKNSGYQRAAGNLNLSHKFSEKLDVDVNASLIRTRADRGITGNDNTNTTFGFSLAFTPSFIDLRPKNGVYPDHPFNPSNPVHTRDVLTNREEVTRTINSMRLKYNVMRSETQNLDFIVQSGFDYFTQQNDVVSPPVLQFERNSSNPGRSLDGKTTNLSWNMYFNLAHLFIMGDMSFQTSAGLQFENLEQDNVLVSSRGITPTQTNITQAAAVDVFQTSIRQYDRGFYIQEEFNYADMLFLNAGLRADRSSAHGDVEKFFMYPKAAASLRISEMDFWADMQKTLSEFKVRVAYGETGNAPPPLAKYVELTPNNIDGSAGAWFKQLRGNKDIKPERTREVEVGFDATIMEDLANIEFSYYRQDITDLIITPDLPSSSGFTEEYVNAGEMLTQGLELGIRAIPVRTADFRWNSTVSWYKTWSEITKLDVDPFNIGGFATFLGTYRIQEGWSPTAIVGAERNPDGSFVEIGNETPDFELGFNNRFTLSDFEFGFHFHWKEGGDVINLGKLITDLGGTTEDYDTGAAANRLDQLGVTTSQYVEDGSYIKLREAYVTYNVPASFLEGAFGNMVHYMRLGLTGRNLLMITDYTGYDPEVSQFGNVAIGRSVDTIPFPSSRSFYFTVALGL